MTNTEKRDWLIGEILAAATNLGFLKDPELLYVTFECPWRATYKIRNTHEALYAFKEKIERCPGFQGRRYRKPEPIGGYSAAKTKLSNAAFQRKYTEDDEVDYAI